MSKKPTRANKKLDDLTKSLRRHGERPTPDVIGAKIREAREAKGWSQARLGDEVGTTQQTIEKIEAGRIKRTSYMTDILFALGLPYERNVRVDQSPVFSVAGRLPVGSFLKVRREALGLERAELAHMANLPESALEHLESLEREPTPLSLEAGVAKAVLDALTPLERNDPHGEPYAFLGYHVAALPAGEVDFAYFRMGAEKGIQFEYFGPSPWELPRLRGFFCLTLASWVKGAFNGRPLKAGARVYARPFRTFKPNEPFSVVAHRANLRPEDVDEVYVGRLIELQRDVFVLDFQEDHKGPTLVLPRNEWNLSQIYFAALSDMSAVYQAVAGKEDENT
jgi:transcriptional regulator with XRE-family HTH domain